jgi:hypothetical protein
VSKQLKDALKAKPSSDLVKASYDAGHAEGRLEAIQESVDAVAALITKAEAMIANLSANADSAIRINADHTLRALHIAFAAVSGSVNGSATFHATLEESKQRYQQKMSAVH